MKFVSRFIAIGYKIKSIIETHSEYIIRKTQLFVKENEYEVNSNESALLFILIICTPYNMNYREDGKFINDFGEGFYDESAIIINLNLLIMDLYIDKER